MPNSTGTIAPLDIPNARFFANKCGPCEIAGKTCGHTPFGKLFPWQLDWWTSRDEGRARFSIEEHARRHRKSSTHLNYQIRECHRLPKTRHNIICPTFEEARRIYWDDPTMLRSALPGERDVDYVLNENRLIVKFPRTGSVLQFYGGDDPENLKGIDGESFNFDEWSLCKPECWSLVVEPIVSQYPTRWVVFAYTPTGMNHATRMFDHACYVDEGDPLPMFGPAARCRTGWYASRVVACRYGENGELIPVSGVFGIDELNRIYSSPDMTRQIFEQEYMCARIRDEEFALITSAMIETLNPDPTQEGDTAIIACDPSQGGDECSIDAHHGNRILERCGLRTKDWNLIYAKLREMSDRHHIYDFIVDAIGIGQAIVVLLRQDERYNVIELDSREKTTQPRRFRNKRAEMYWNAMEEMRRYGVQRPPDPETRRQLPFASRYHLAVNGAIQILEKDDIRKLLGCSPDRADSFVMARYGLPMARPYLGGQIEFQPVRKIIMPSQPQRKDLFRRERFYRPIVRR